MKFKSATAALGTLVLSAGAFADTTSLAGAISGVSTADTQAGMYGAIALVIGVVLIGFGAKRIFGLFR